MFGVRTYNMHCVADIIRLPNDVLTPGDQAVAGRIKFANGLHGSEIS
jgi:hypothetical protein